MIWNKIKEFVDKTHTDRETGEKFLSGVLALGAVGVFFCILWFIGLCIEGIPLGYLIFDVAIIIFCAWAIIKCIIPTSKEAFKHLEKMEYKDKETNCSTCNREDKPSIPSHGFRGGEDNY